MSKVIMPCKSLLIANTTGFLFIRIIPILLLRQQTFIEYLPGPPDNQRCWQYKAKRDTVLKELNPVSIFFFP